MGSEVVAVQPPPHLDWPTVIVLALARVASIAFASVVFNEYTTTTVGTTSAVTETATSLRWWWWWWWWWW